MESVDVPIWSTLLYPQPVGLLSKGQTALPIKQTETMSSCKRPLSVQTSGGGGKKKKEAGDRTQAVEFLTKIHDTLGLVPGTI